MIVIYINYFLQPGDGIFCFRVNRSWSDSRLHVNIYIVGILEYIYMYIYTDVQLEWFVLQGCSLLSVAHMCKSLE